jgi:hypothetical protein
MTCQALKVWDPSDEDENGPLIFASSCSQSCWAPSTASESGGPGGHLCSGRLLSPLSSFLVLYVDTQFSIRRLVLILAHTPQAGKYLVPQSFY